MLVLYCVLGLLIYNLIVFIIGKINFKEKAKEYIFYILSIIYNGFMGYIDTYVLVLLYGYFSNTPKGSAYEVPESEAGFYGMLGLITLLIYIFLLIPINIYMQRKGNISKKMYTIINIIATALGIIIFWIFLDKNKSLF